MAYDDSMTRGMLDVPGASLCYEVRGSGPTLLLIPRGAADAVVFAGLIPFLATYYSVVTYDPRGLSRSPVDDRAQDILVEVQADDAHRLLSTITSEPAFIFGTSAGAITGLSLVEQHPEQVRTLIAHEPPVMELLPDRDAIAVQNEEIYQIYLRQGVGPAMMKFLAMNGLNAGGPPSDEGPAASDSRLAEAMARMQPNLDLFLGHMLREIVAYRPDADRLRAGSTRIVVARGTTSEGQLAYRAATALAAVLGAEPVQFPGDHGGYATDPEHFAQTLRRVLAG